MKPLRFSEEFEALFTSAALLAKAVKAHALLLLVEGPADWERLSQFAMGEPVIVAADHAEELEGAAQAGLATTVLEMPQSAVHEKLAQALVDAVAEGRLETGARVVALYSGFDERAIDTVSLIDLGDHLGRLTVRDLRQLHTKIPLDTLQTVVNLAVEIGREGREGKPVGTLFVVGDTVKVRKLSRSAGFDPVKGYSRKERNLRGTRVREAIKEIAQMDGAILVAADGTVEAAAQYLNASAPDVLVPRGLGARHWAAAAVSRLTKAIAVCVSESTGTVRIFQDGEVVLRIEPFRRPLKWKDFDAEGDAPGS